MGQIHCTKFNLSLKNIFFIFGVLYLTNHVYDNDKQENKNLPKLRN